MAGFAPHCPQSLVIRHRCLTAGLHAVSQGAISSSLITEASSDNFDNVASDNFNALTAGSPGSIGGIGGMPAQGSMQSHSAGRLGPQVCCTSCTTSLLCGVPHIASQPRSRLCPHAGGIS